MCLQFRRRRVGPVVLEEPVHEAQMPATANESELTLNEPELRVAEEADEDDFQEISPEEAAAAKAAAEAAANTELDQLFKELGVPILGAQTSISAGTSATAAPEGETNASAGERSTDANVPEPTPLAAIPNEPHSSEPRENAPTRVEETTTATADASTTPIDEEAEREASLDEVDPNSALVLYLP